MKLISLHINGYKNLKGKAKFDFSQADNYSALIGLNGSGKSNVIEAISLIFASLYRNVPIKAIEPKNDFTYIIKYEIANSIVEITNGNYHLVEENGIVKNKKISTNKKSFLPNEIIACYSGDEQRMWNSVYSSFYFSYFNKVVRGYRSTKQNLVYVNKFSWEFALISLLCYEPAHSFLKELLKIDDLTQVTIHFNFHKEYDKRLNAFKKEVEKGIETRNDIVELIGRIKTDQESINPQLSYTQISTIDLGFGISQENVKSCRKLFYTLFASGMYLKKKLFNSIDIGFNKLNITALSEGEKRLLLVKCIMDILANDKSLILFDEPDAHLHIARKKELKTLLDKENYYSIITTHSPALLSSISDANSFILNDKGKGVEVNQSSKFSTLKQISNNEFTLMDGVLAISSTKDIVLVEGKYDEKYLNKALAYFKSINNKYDVLDFVFVNAGGAGNIIEIFNKINRSISSKQLFITICDDDFDGRSAIAEVSKKLTKLNKANFKAITYPKTSTKKYPNDFLLEDYFLVSTYKNVYSDKVAKAKNFKDLTSFPDPKNYIKNNYTKFKPVDFKGFKKIIDLLLKFKTVK